jgi:hypothetical protein
MKHLFLLLTGFFLLTGTVLMASPMSVSALSAAKQQNCYDTYNGLSGKKLTSKLLNNFKNADKECRHQNGGNCTLDTSGSKSISCESPDASQATPSSNSGGDQSGSGSTEFDGDLGDGGAVADPAARATCNEKQCDLVQKYINPFITVLSVLVGLAIAIGIIFGGIQVSTSAGDPQKSASGKKHIQNALIALVAYVVLFGFLQWLIPGGAL